MNLSIFATIAMIGFNSIAEGFVTSPSSAAGIFVGGKQRKATPQLNNLIIAAMEPSGTSTMPTGSAPRLSTSVVGHDESSDDLLCEHPRKIKVFYGVVAIIAHIQKPFHLMGALFGRLCKKNHTPRDGGSSDEGLKKTPTNKKDSSDDDTQKDFRPFTNVGANFNKGQDGKEPGIGQSIQESVPLLSAAVTDHGTSVGNGLGSVALGLGMGLGSVALGLGSIALSQLAIVFVPLIVQGHAH